MGLSEREEDKSAYLDACYHGIASTTACCGNHGNEQPKAKVPRHLCVSSLGKVFDLPGSAQKKQADASRVAKFDSLPVAHPPRFGIMTRGLRLPNHPVWSRSMSLR